ncbi:hypothetical protein [Streptomyces zagrosensis]|uniref:DNA primase/polymerase bifunctional N-terminal domain-containing protein n=1 Tax=Streptomyces zagrosensis TaxID=1042984 RepID=A0A7W9Q9F3_9ACTN|nr:hypothetical protein [Streptomyces zagrosensis]MBB5936034.1 hypothetical protein [Streptomyces zagrosensis]
MSDAGARSSVRWLASAASDPEACLADWERNPLGVALLPAGRLWDVLIMSGEVGGPTFDMLSRSVERLGPVLADFSDSQVGFFVPPGTATRWVATGVRGVGHGAWLVVPYPGRATGGVRWINPPDGSGTLIGSAALELAMREAASPEPAPGEGG